MDPLRPYTVRPIRGRYLVDGPGSDGIPLTTKAQAEAIANLMNVAYGMGHERGIAEADNPGCTIHGHDFTDAQWRASNGCPACVADSERWEDE